MQVICIYGTQVRVGLMLKAIGAQEALEVLESTKPPSGWRAAQYNAFNRQRLGLARRRNAAERRLTVDEHMAWERWRIASPAEREAVRAVLTDLPGREEGRPQA